jgi:hypothetical protein
MGNKVMWGLLLQEHRVTQPVILSLGDDTGRANLSLSFFFGATDILESGKKWYNLSVHVLH